MASFEMLRTYATNLWLGLFASSCGKTPAFELNKTTDSTKWQISPSTLHGELDPIFVSVAALR